jgi:hypothetical protein
MSVPTPTEQSTEDQVPDLHAVMEKLATAVATIQGNQGQLTVAINQMQSDKLLQTDDNSFSTQLLTLSPSLATSFSSPPTMAKMTCCHGLTAATSFF